MTELDTIRQQLAEAKARINSLEETEKQLSDNVLWQAGEIAKHLALIEASRKQEPVARVVEKVIRGLRGAPDIYRYEFVLCAPALGPCDLFAAPVVADDLLKDAQRYRWLRESDSDEACVMAYIEGLDEWVAYDSAESVDMAIDAAIGGVA